ncbi:hypothetical protein GCM10009530_34740 [Microbispora corallina]|uniref:Uncharacterized protein n=1 Tax=Microbispora corallina TaxID=83302 RepID=A0ABQ4G1K3_9ACTN|nr:hypothetical protein Mco01_39510 [Microbispora corallina]
MSSDDVRTDMLAGLSVRVCGQDKLDCNPAREGGLAGGAVMLRIPLADPARETGQATQPGPVKGADVRP